MTVVTYPRINGDISGVVSQMVATASDDAAGKTVLAGDSQIDQQDNYSAGSYLNREARFFTLHCQKNDHPYVYETFMENAGSTRTGHNGGNSGDTTTELLDRYEPDVIRKRPSEIVLMIGTNDCVTDTIDLDTVTIPNIKHMILRGIEIGALVKVIPVGPRVSGSANDWPSAAIKRRYQKLNAAISAFVAQTPGCREVDIWKNLKDASGDLISAASPDGVHLGVYGSYIAMLDYDADVVAHGGGKNRAARNVADLYTVTDIPYGNLIPCNFNTSGGTAGTGASGTIPTSFTVARTTGGNVTVACSTVARDDGKPGYWLEMEFTTDGANSNTDVIRLSVSDFTTGVVTDDYYKASIDFQSFASDDGNPRLIMPLMRFTDKSNSSTNARQVFSTPTSPDQWPNIDTPVFNLLTAPLQYKGSTGLTWKMEFQILNTNAGTQVARVAMPCIRGMSTAPVLT